MRIANIQAADGPMRIGAEARRTHERPARTAEEHTGDLLALSAGMSLRAMLEKAEAGREAAVRQLADAWESGAYRPDPERIANKLIDWGLGPK